MSDASFDEAIAVIGMDARLPGADNVEEYWHNLVNGVESITRFTAEELDPSVPEEQRRQPNYVPARGLLKDADKFDAEFFGISPREAEMLDPQQRVFLEMVWRGLEDAGYAPDRTTQPVGVFAGMSYNTYFAAHVAKHPRKLANYGDIPAMIANEKDYLATRAAYKLNLRGPAINISTACSTSLVAVAHAFNSLLEYQCDIAVAGGISILCPQERGYVYAEGSIYSPDGRCRPFDVNAKGTLFGNGGGVVVLKRLSEALADGDTVHAVIRGAALNNDGAERVSFTAPGVEGQANVIRMAQEIAGVHPDEIDYVEAHGTGTSLGDPIEIAALTRAFRSGTQRRGYCGVGSVKGNIGHLDAASGIAGLIKAVLALRERKLPATLHFSAPNPKLGLDESPFHIVDSLREWPAVSGRPLRAAVSSFGLGGTNAHVILEQAPPLPATGAGRPQQLLLLSARSEAALQRAADALGEYLRGPGRPSLPDIAWTLQTGRTPFEHRLALVAGSREEAADIIERKDVARVQQRQAEREAPGVVFMFPGQGSQYAGMGRQLYETEAVVRETIDTCAGALSGVLDHDLRDVMFDRIDNAVELLDETRYTQPALFALELALGKLWMSWGIQPAAMLGHSIGEYAAATLAGVFRVEDAVRIVAERGRLMQDQAPGSMLSVRLPERDLEPYLQPGITVAAVNAPELCVVSGEDAPLNKLRHTLDREGVRHSTLRTSHAFHSELMTPVLKPFTRFLEGFALSAPRLPVVSTLTGEALTAEQAADPAYWARQLREPVRFHAALRTARNAQPRIFLEAGPGIAGCTFAGQTFAADEAASVAASLGRQGDAPDEYSALLTALGRLWLHGVSPDWQAVHAGETRRRVPAPTYRFERVRHWLASTGERADEQALVARASAQPEAPAEKDANADPKDSVRKLIAEVTGFGVEKIADDATFTEIGLDSLALTQFGQLLYKRFGIDLRLRQLLEDHATPAAIATLIEARRPQAEKTAAVPLEKDTPESGRAEAAMTLQAERPARAAPALTERQRAFVRDLCQRYTWRTSGSRSFMRTHREHLAGTCVSASADPLLKELAYPIVLRASNGARVEDVDGNVYVDLVNGFGANLLGHSVPLITEAVRRQLVRGVDAGPEHPLAGRVAGLLQHMTGFERVAFTGGGNDAVLTALAAARTATGRGRIAVFRNARHDAAVSSLQNVDVIDHGSGAIEHIASIAAELAAVLVEPAPALQPERHSPEFLRALREATQRNGCALVFDETVSGFRVHPGGVQGLIDVRADIVAYGEACSGGLPLGVVAGQPVFMEALDTRALPDVPARHPLALAAADAVLAHLQARGASLQRELADRTAELVDVLETHCRATGAPIRFHRFASWFVIEADPAWRGLLFSRLRLGGVHLLEGQPCFLTAAHTGADVQAMGRVFRESLDELQAAGFFQPAAASKPDGKAVVAHGASVANLETTAARRKSPPCPGARLGRRPDGQPAWFIPDPARPGRYRELRGQEAP